MMCGFGACLTCVCKVDKANISKRQDLESSFVQLATDENYGYALIQRVRELSGGRIEWTEGMLYPVLHWMEKEGLIESEWREADTGRKRKYYRLRKEGRKALHTEREQWMTIHETLGKLWKTLPTPT